MYIQEIKWMDKKNKEAVLKIAANTESIICYFITISSSSCVNGIP